MANRLDSFAVNKKLVHLQRNFPTLSVCQHSHRRVFFSSFSSVLLRVLSFHRAKCSHVSSTLSSFRGCAIFTTIFWVSSRSLSMRWKCIQLSEFVWCTVTISFLRHFFYFFFCIIPIRWRMKGKTHTQYTSNLLQTAICVCYFSCAAAAASKHQVHFNNSFLIVIFFLFFSRSSLWSALSVSDVCMFSEIWMRAIKHKWLTQKPNVAPSCYRHLFHPFCFNTMHKLNWILPAICVRERVVRVFFCSTCGMSIKCVEERMKFNIYIIYWHRSTAQSNAWGNSIFNTLDFHPAQFAHFMPWL